MVEVHETRRPRGPLATALTARPVLEPILFVLLAILYVWVIQPIKNDWLRIPYMTFLVLMPFISGYLHGDRLKDLGLRLDNFWASAREVGLFTVVAAVAVLGIGLLAGAQPVSRPGIVRAILVYPFWGLAQQYAMQSFAFRRMREGTAGPGIAAAITAFLFAIVHWPNLALALATLAGGFAWCLLFDRRPNLIILAISHGWLAVLLRASWPAEWLRNLRIGPDFWTWTP